MWAVETLILIAAAFLIAGTVKGVVGMGLPTVSLAILTATIGLRDAMALMILPAVTTNIWQGLAGPAFGDILKRFWPMAAATVIGTFVGLKIGIGLPTELLAAVLGGILLVYAVTGLRGFTLTIQRSKEWFFTPAMGLAGGTMSGLVGVFIVPGIIYLQVLRMPKDLFVQTAGVMLTVATLTLGVALSGFELYSSEHGMISAAALVPAFAGMYLGQKVRARLSEDLFRVLVFYALAIFGIYLILGAVL